MSNIAHHIKMYMSALCQRLPKKKLKSVMYAFNSHLSYKYNTSPNPYDNK